jgi:hypothetical protein
MTDVPTFEDGTPKTLERVQWEYDQGVRLRDEAQAVLRDREKGLVRLREQVERVKRANAPPVDRTQRQLSGGGEVTSDHRELKDNGQQKGYVVLTEAERAKGFTRPYRDAYRHQKCGAITTMSRDIAATYARDPFFYSGTFCTTCRGHFPVGEDGEFTWYEMNGSEGPKVGT